MYFNFNALKLYNLPNLYDYFEIFKNFHIERVKSSSWQKNLHKEAWFTILLENPVKMCGLPCVDLYCQSSHQKFNFSRTLWEDFAVTLSKQRKIKPILLCQKINCQFQSNFVCWLSKTFGIWIFSEVTKKKLYYPRSHQQRK